MKPQTYPLWVYRLVRLILAIIAGYLVTDAYVRASSTSLVSVGVGLADASAFSLLSCLIVYVCVAIWVVATRSPIRTFLILSGLIAMMTALTYLLP